jgi:competence protein ComEC
VSGPVTPAPLGSVLGPLPVWAVAGIAGSLAGEMVAARSGWASAPTAGGLALIGVTVALLALVRVAGSVQRGGDEVVPVVAGVLAALVVAMACGGGVVLRIATTSMGLLPELADRGGQAEVLATVVAEPRPIATGWHVLVQVAEVDGLMTRERAALTRDGEPPPLGSSWRARVSARPLPDGGYGRWLARQHAVVVLDPVTWDAAGSPGRLASASEEVRERVRQAATRHLDDRVGGLLVGFVTGDRRLLPEADQDAMRATGLTHLTAVSGSNVAIVVAGVLGLTTMLRVGARGRRGAVLLVIPWFALVTRFEPSVLRAGTMAVLLLLAGSRGQARDARHALAGAVLALVLIDPRLAGSLGLLLSATATVGVLVVAPLVRVRLPERLPRRLAELTSITIGAQVAVVPVLLVTFGEIGLATIPANLVAVPAAAIAATLAFLGTALAVVHVEPGSWLFALAGPPTQVVLAAAHGFSDVGGVVEVERPATVVALLAACGWVLVRRGRPAARWCAGTVVVALLVSSVPMATGRLPASGFTVTAIDVGQGDAFLVETSGARILIDAGEGDAAARWLRQNGRTRLDLVVATHPHLDHIGGVPEVLRSARVDVLWASPLPTALPEAAEAFAVADAQGVPVRAPVAGAVVPVGDVLIEVLHPPPGRPYRFSRSELNESSYVLRLHHDGRRVLVTGDVELEAQADLLAGARDQLAAELFTVPHHGSQTTDPAFLTAIAGQVGLVSAGRDNRHGHPHATTIATLEALGVAVRRTDLEGTVTVEVPHPPVVGTVEVPHPPVVGDGAGLPPGTDVLRAAPRRARRRVAGCWVSTSSTTLRCGRSSVSPGGRTDHGRGHRRGSSREPPRRSSPCPSPA